MLPSLHGSLLFVNTHPVAGLQVSVVQPSPSLHATGVPPAHAPPEQVSVVVHALPSLHGSVLLVCVQPVAGSHASLVHIQPHNDQRPTTRSLCQTTPLRNQVGHLGRHKGRMDAL